MEALDEFVPNEGSGPITGCVVSYSGRYLTDTAEVREPGPAADDVVVTAVEVEVRVMVPIAHTPLKRNQSLVISTPPEGIVSGLDLHVGPR